MYSTAHHSYRDDFTGYCIGLEGQDSIGQYILQQQGNEVTR